MSIAEIATRDGITPREAFIRELKTRGVKYEGSSLHYEPAGDAFMKNATENDVDENGGLVIAIAGLDSCSVKNTKTRIEIKCVPYSTITIDLINAVAGEPK